LSDEFTVLLISTKFRFVVFDLAIYFDLIQQTWASKPIPFSSSRCRCSAPPNRGDGRCHAFACSYHKLSAGVVAEFLRLSGSHLDISHPERETSNEFLTQSANLLSPSVYFTFPNNANKFTLLISSRIRSKMLLQSWYSLTLPRVLPREMALIPTRSKWSEGTNRICV